MTTFKEEVVATAREVIRMRAQDHQLWLDTLGKISVSLKILRLDCKGKLSMDKQSQYCDSYEYISTYANADRTIDIARLRTDLNAMLSEGDIDNRQTRQTDPAAGLPQSPTSFDSAGEEQVEKEFDETTRRRRTVVDAIKVYLPSTRSRLPGLRTSPEGELHTDTATFCELASAFWSGIWKEREDSHCRSPEDIAAYCGVNDYADGLITPIPTQSEIIKALRESGNSCPGPDGIPFAALRALANVFAPLAVGVIWALAQGALPPEGFNHAILFLLPKKGTHTPADTRPISVTNTDNRIIAAAIVLAISPTIAARLDPAQQGFVKTRCYHQHIFALNEDFYGAVESGNI